MRINVTQKDIDRARKLVDFTDADCDHTQICPIALAVKRKMHRRVEVDGVVISLDGGMERCFELPTAARRFVKKFDAGKPVEPFSFEASPT